MRRETESLILAVQNQSIRTNLKQSKRLIKVRKTCYADSVRKPMEVYIIFLVDAANLHRSIEEGKRHDNLGKIVHWKLARKCNFEAGDKSYKHESGSVLEKEDYKIFWNFGTQTDVIEARRPDLVVVDKKRRACKLIDFAVPGGSRIKEKEKEKIEKYQDPRRDIQKVWNV